MSETDGGDILIRIRGDASSLEAEISRAQAALGNLEDSAGSAEGSLGGMGDAADGAGQAMEGMSRGGISGLAAGLRQVNPGLGTALIGFAGLKRAIPGISAMTLSLSGVVKGLSTALKGLWVSLGPVGIAIVAATALYAAYGAAIAFVNRDLDDLNKSLEATTKANNALYVSLSGMEAMERQVAQGRALQRGETTKTAIEIEKFNAKVDDQTKKQIEAQKASQITAEQREKNTEGIHARSNALKQSNQLLQQEIAAERALEASMLARAAAARTALATERELAGVEADRIAGIHSGMAKITSDLDRVTAEVSAGMDQVVADMTATIGIIEQTIVKNAAAIENGISDTLTGVSQLSGTLANALAEDNKKAAMALFRTSQAAALGNVAMNTGVAIVRTLAELGPIAGPVAAIGIGALGAAQAAAIASQAPPVAHIGTPAGGSMAPDERMSYGRRVLNTEMSTPGAVANSTATQTIDDANNGRLNTGGGSITAVIGRSHLDTELFRSGRQGSTRFSRLLRTNPHPKPQGGW